jgi:hypothetical protein
MLSPIFYQRLTVKPVGLFGVPIVDKNGDHINGAAGALRTLGLQGRPEYKDEVVILLARAGDSFDEQVSVRKIRDILNNLFDGAKSPNFICKARNGK